MYFRTVDDDIGCTRHAEIHTQMYTNNIENKNIKKNNANNAHTNNNNRVRIMASISISYSADTQRRALLYAERDRCRIHSYFTSQIRTHLDV